MLLECRYYICKGVSGMTIEQSFQKALGTYTSFVKDRLKNGEPKFQIGGAAMSEKEWKNLINKVDASLDQIKDELAKRLETLKEKEADQKVEKQKKDQKKILEENEKDKEEKEILEKTMEELNRISLAKKAAFDQRLSMKEAQDNKVDIENEVNVHDRDVHDRMEVTDEQIRKLLEDK